MSIIQNPGAVMNIPHNNNTKPKRIACKVPGRKTVFRHGYPLGILEEEGEDNQLSFRQNLFKNIESGIYDNASEDEDDFSSFELGDEEMDDDFSMDYLQLSHMSTSSSSAPHYFQGSRNSTILPLLLLEGEVLSSSMYSDTKATDKIPEEDPELEYEYEPGISLGQFEFAQEEALHGGNPFIDYEADLQLAAELGKTLLERNKELENVVEQHQSLVEDQSHEIEYLTKQNLVLREVNESRLKVYEQLEVSINDLEDSNRKLVEESKSDKSRIKSLVLANNRLESRMEELQRSMEESSSRNRVITTTSTSSRSKRRERRRCSKSDTDTGSSSSSIQSSSSDDKFLECNDSLILNKDECSSNEVEEDIGSKEVLSEEDEETSLTKDTSSETSSRIGSNSPASSGYSSEQPYRFSISSSDNFENKSCLPLSIPNKDESSSTSGNSESDSPFMVSQQKISELQKAFTHLNSENALLKEEIEKTKQQQEDADTVQEEVLKIKDVKIGKLCRRCLGNIENPLAQGLNAVQQIVQQVQSDFVHELFRQHTANNSSSNSNSLSEEQAPSLRRDWGLLIRSQNKWLDLWLFVSCLMTVTLGLGISMICK